jgi:hypothetical protein
MTIDQRNNGSSVTNPGNNVYIVDRWLINTAFTGSVGQNLGGVTPPAGFSNYLGMSVGAGGQSATNYSFRQWIEGFNSADLAFGTANAQTVTLSFWVRSSLTGTFGGALQNEAGNRSYPFGYTIASANTWQKVTVTIPGDTTGTWVGATNGYGIQVIISYGAAAARQGTAGAWAAADYRSVTGQVDLISTNGATFYITGVQLEKGQTATSFDYLPYGTELNLCQRYYFRNQSGTLYGRYGMALGSGSTVAKLDIFLPVQLRASSTSIDYGGSIAVWNGSTVTSVSSFTVDVITPLIATLNANVASGLSAGSLYEVFNNNNTAGYIGINAEL